MNERSPVREFESLAGGFPGREQIAPVGYQPGRANWQIGLRKRTLRGGPSVVFSFWLKGGLSRPTHQKSREGTGRSRIKSTPSVALRMSVSEILTIQ